jgi:hypothetical protein
LLTFSAEGKGYPKDIGARLQPLQLPQISADERVIWSLATTRIFIGDEALKVIRT